MTRLDFAVFLTPGGHTEIHSIFSIDARHGWDFAEKIFDGKLYTLKLEKLITPFLCGKTAHCIVIDEPAFV